MLKLRQRRPLIVVQVLDDELALVKAAELEAHEFTLTREVEQDVRLELVLKRWADRAISEVNEESVWVAKELHKRKPKYPLGGCNGACKETVVLWTKGG